MPKYLGDLIEEKVFDFLYGKETKPRFIHNSMCLFFERDHPEEYAKIVKECEEILARQSPN